MKRIRLFKKKSSKIGFTLLEVVLSIAIMLVLTTMMMNGFAATMSYSFHTSVYASTAAANYDKVLTNIAKAVKSDRAAFRSLPSYANAAGEVEISLDQTIASVPGNKFTVRLFKANDGAAAANNNGYRSVAETWEAGTGTDGSYANNRTSFYFRPTVIGANTSDAANTSSASYGNCFIYLRYVSGSWQRWWRNEAAVNEKLADATFTGDINDVGWIAQVTEATTSS